MSKKPLTKALFLDRDGVINQDKGYVYKKEDIEFIDGIFELCQQAQQLGFLIIIVTNQSGIARGLYDEEHFFHLTQWMKQQFLKNNVNITDVFYCPHHPDYGDDRYRKVCSCRKPAPGMLNKAIAMYGIDVSKSVLIGDKWSDLQAGEKAKLRQLVLLHTRETKVSVKSEFESNRKIQTITSLHGAIQFLV